MTAAELELAFFASKGGAYRVAVTRFTPDGWYECDLFAVTRAGIGHEFELKVSRNDFERDSSKEEKYTRLLRGDGPAYFWFLMPAELVPVASVPVFAGVVWCRRASFSNGRGQFTLRVERAARRLHDGKVSESVITTALAAAYQRYVRVMA